jgi:multidrug efflux pump subunit AcrA (membrane-fusion protein)
MRVAEMNAIDAQYNQHVLRDELVRAQALLNQRKIISPFDGVVVERLMSPGEYRSEQSQVLTIAKVDPLNVEVFAPIAFYGQTAVGWSAEIMPEAPVGGLYRATVTVVDHVVDAASGTFGVRLELPNPGNKLPAGLRCKALFAPAGPTKTAGQPPPSP